MFTQPKMYTTIKNHPTTLKLYRQQLIDAGHVTAEEAASIQAFVDKSLADAFDNRNDHVPKPTALESVWEKCVHPHVTAPPRLTGVSEAQLRAVGDVLTTVPEGFTLHNTLKRTIAAKAKMFETGVGFDWATAEALAFGSLLMEGNTVRLSGQDVQRGTFSHRHSKWHDQKDFSRRYMPLANLSEKQGQFVAANSSLSEFGVLGYVLGLLLRRVCLFVCLFVWLFGCLVVWLFVCVFVLVWRSGMCAHMFCFPSTPLHTQLRGGVQPAPPRPVGPLGGPVR